MDVHALDGSRAVVRSHESVGTEAPSGAGTCGEARHPALGNRHVHLAGARQAGHPATGERTTLELVLDDEDAVTLHSPRGLDARSGRDAPPLQHDRHGCMMLGTALKPHEDQGRSGIK
jgi:hypothetical protein